MLFRSLLLALLLFPTLLLIIRIQPPNLRQDFPAPSALLVRFGAFDQLHESGVGGEPGETLRFASRRGGFGGEELELEVPARDFVGRALAGLGRGRGVSACGEVSGRVMRCGGVLRDWACNQ